ncbi:MAG: flagellar hook assembly protein FlgD [Betaproteobacteria bacterium]|jgi:flagellar basal-body rod modification protein FlgD|uniref:Basal-body rod modification protein FlgD n=1 Tax=Candidatus Proximibacter danicus TaxID=2954365 RepID=A0A9D7JYF3_9PROT|nr:flagellar hook assembly protein FlgD [Candidatus Proximibacter danicus]
MATVQSTSTNTASDVFASLGPTAAAKTANSAEEMQNRFLKLLTTQLRNQDPLNPMENAEMTSQLAQINTINGIEKLNTTLGKMLDIYDSGQSMQAAGLIGKHVLVPGNTLPLAGGQALGGALLAEAADEVTVSVLDRSGNLLQSQQLGPRSAGNVAFNWDGKKTDGTQMADGSYTFRVEAVRGGQKVEATSLQVGMVNAVIRSNGGFLLDLGAQGNVSYKDVQQII